MALTASRAEYRGITRSMPNMPENPRSNEDDSTSSLDKQTTSNEGLIKDLIDQLRTIWTRLKEELSRSSPESSLLNHWAPMPVGDLKSLYQNNDFLRRENEVTWNALQSFVDTELESLDDAERQIITALRDEPLGLDSDGIALKCNKSSAWARKLLPGLEARHFVRKEGTLYFLNVQAIPERPDHKAQGDSIRMLRELRRVTQNDLASAIGRQQSDISRWESGDVALPPDMRRRIIAFLRQKADPPGAEE